jgi:hypothetical protein
MMSFMAAYKLSERYKFPSRTHPDLLERFDAALRRYHSKVPVNIGPTNRKLTAEAMLNAAILHFLEMEAAERDRVVLANVPRYEALLDTGEIPSANSEALPLPARPAASSPEVIEPLDPSTGSPLKRGRRRSS